MPEAEGRGAGSQQDFSCQGCRGVGGRESVGGRPAEEGTAGPDPGRPAPGEPVGKKVLETQPFRELEGGPPLLGGACWDHHLSSLS